MKLFAIFTVYLIAEAVGSTSNNSIFEQDKKIQDQCQVKSIKPS